MNHDPVVGADYSSLDAEHCTLWAEGYSAPFVHSPRAEGFSAPFEDNNIPHIECDLPGAVYCPAAEYSAQLAVVPVPPVHSVFPHHSLEHIVGLLRTPPVLADLATLVGPISESCQAAGHYALVKHLWILLLNVIHP